MPSLHTLMQTRKVSQYAPGAAGWPPNWSGMQSSRSVGEVFDRTQANLCDITLAAASTSALDAAWFSSCCCFSPLPHTPVLQVCPSHSRCQTGGRVGSCLRSSAQMRSSSQRVPHCPGCTALCRRSICGRLAQRWAIGLLGKRLPAGRCSSECACCNELASVEACLAVQPNMCHVQMQQQLTSVHAANNHRPVIWAAHPAAPA